MNNKLTMSSFPLDQKLEMVDYEAGSGTLAIPILGDLFPGLFGGRGQEMREIKKYVFVVDGRKYQVGKDVFHSAKEGDLVNICRNARNNELVKMEIQLDGRWVSF